MKKIVCWWLQKENPNKRVEMEEEVGPSTIPDINVNKKEFWECMHSFPSIV
jgi:hypothetical protein